MDSIRSLLLIVALACIAMMATNVTLFAHVETHHHTHENHHEEKTSLPQQDEDCHTCFVIGSIGKYICTCFGSIECADDEALFTDNVESQFIYQHHPGLLAARGPPAS